MSDYGTSIQPGPGEPLVIVEEGWDPIQGDTVTYEWRGTEADIRFEMAAQKLLGRKTSLQIPAFDGGDLILRATAGASESQPEDEPLSDRWTMHWNSLEKSIWTLPIVVEQLRTGYQNNKAENGHTVAQWKKDMKSLAAGEEITARGVTETVDDDVTITFEILRDLAVSVLGMDADVIDHLISDLIEGQESYRVDQCVLRRTIVLPANSTFPIPSENMGRMLTLASLRTDGLPVDQVFERPLPLDGYWEKQRPEVDQTSADKWTVTLEYWHAPDYSRLTYGEPI